MCKLGLIDLIKMQTILIELIKIQIIYIIPPPPTKFQTTLSKPNFDFVKCKQNHVTVTPYVNKYGGREYLCKHCRRTGHFTLNLIKHRPFLNKG